MAEEKNSCGFRTSIGGQALIEGILMRGPESRPLWSGIRTETWWKRWRPCKMIRTATPFLGMPLIRGTVNFLAAMVSGVRALMYSADFYPEEEASSPPDLSNGWSGISPAKLDSAIVMLAVAMGVGLSVFLFMVLPTFLTGGLLHLFPDFPMWGRNLMEGILGADLPGLFDCVF
ncbi:MAG: DUF1385 domain-containing protein [Oscillospiraceae bacterium]